MWNAHPITDYFRNDVLQKRTYLRLEWCLAAIENPARREVQPEDGRIRQWIYVQEHEKYLRVVTLADAVTIHNAFFDRRFKP